MKTELIIICFFVASVFASPGFRPKGCEEIQKVAQRKGQNATSGVYKVFPPVKNTLYRNGVDVFCDMETEQGGWTVIQRRRESQSTQINFYREWVEYANGFGVMLDSFWLGLELIYELTQLGNFKLRVDLMNWEGVERYAEYALFQVGNSTNNYTLTISGYSGSAPDYLTYHNGMQFSTKDRDNDLRADHCAQSYKGAWWYRWCYQSNLNGVYGNTDGTGINWGPDSYRVTSKRVEMKIHRVENDANFGQPTM